MDHVISDISKVIQLAVAPVFLITGIAGFLSVLSNRLARVTDRARQLESRLPYVEPGEKADLLLSEVDSQWLRIRIVNWAIALLVASTLSICGVVMCMFLADMLTVDLSRLIAISFVAAMALVILALLLLLLEVFIATRKMRKGLEHLLDSGGSRSTDYTED